MSDKVRCPQCGKMVSKQGLGGHLFGKHLIRTGHSAEIARLADETQQARTELKQLKEAISHIVGYGGTTITPEEASRRLYKIRCLV